MTGSRDPGAGGPPRPPTRRWRWRCSPAPCRPPPRRARVSRRPRRRAPPTRCGPPTPRSPSTAGSTRRPGRSRPPSRSTTRPSRPTTCRRRSRPSSGSPTTTTGSTSPSRAHDPEPGEDPRPPPRPRQRLPGRLRRHRARHLQRRAPRLRVLRQPAGRADGPLPERRHRQRGRLLGRDLGLGRPDHRRRATRSRWRSRSPRCASSAPTGVQTWGIDTLRIWPRDQRARASASTRMTRGRNCYLCHESQAHRLRGHHAGAQHRARPDAHRPAHRRARSDSPAASIEDGDAKSSRAHRALGHHART